jgi:hypothetical protein
MSDNEVISEDLVPGSTFTAEFLACPASLSEPRTLPPVCSAQFFDPDGSSTSGLLDCKSVLHLPT